MEQSSGKKERLMLAAGLGFALALAAAQCFSPAAKALGEGRDLRLALLGGRAPVLLICHPAASTVNAVFFPRAKIKKGVSGYQRASDLAALAAAPGQEAPGEILYISLSSAPEMNALWGVLNDWRSAPRKFVRAAAWAARLRAEGDTNISAFDLFVIFSEFSKLNQANFISTEISRPDARGGGEAVEESAPEPQLRVEIFNASGKKDLAVRAAKHLRAAGFDVLTASSYAKIEKHTIIMCFSEDTAPARKLRAALGLEELEIRVSAPRRSVASATVILGADFNDGLLDR
ncbi:MAG: LytR C-terminal domain-containing protein [Elusimicrobia bacterium]|nr:LytR C-terminal domain-containing protein [Elusimicrobiota bacterium]